MELENKRIEALRNLNILDTPQSKNFDRITSMAQIILEVPIALVSLVDSNRQWFKSCQGISAKETPRSVSFCSHAILNNNIFEIPDTLEDERFRNNPLVTEYPYIRFYAGRPIKGTTEYNIGTLCIIDKVPRKLSLGDKKILNDLAEWIENEFAVIELNKKVESNIQSKKELVSMMNHELKNTLSPIVGFSDLLINPEIYLTEIEKRQYIESIKDCSSKLQSQISDLMDVFKSDLNSLKVDIKKTNVNEIINNCCNKIQPILKNKNIELSIDLKYKDDIHCDKNRIEQVINNLFLNSIDFVEKNTGKIKISTTKTIDNLVIFSIEDNGCGIPEDKIKTLFFKFSKPNNNKKREYGGSGLGLAICKGIIDAHQGSIWLDVNHKKGSKFLFSLSI